MASRPVESEDAEDGLFFWGLLNGVLFSIPIWAAILYIVFG